MPGRRASEFSTIKDSNLASQLASPSRHSGAFIPTVGSVVEKFNFGLKEQLKKAEKSNQELQAKYQELLKSMEFISSDNSKLKSSQSVLQEEKKALESKYHKLKSHADVMKADYDRVNTKLSNLEVANESLKQTSWLRRSKKGKGSSAASAHDGAVAANEISTLKEQLVKKDARISELEKEVVSEKEKLKQAVLESQQAKPVHIKVENVEDEIDIEGHHEALVDTAVLNLLDRQSILIEYKKLLGNYNKKEIDLKEHQDQISNLEKRCAEQRKELVMLSMEVNKGKDNHDCALSGSNNALNHSPQSSVDILGVPSCVVKSASFDNGRKISLPARREAVGSPDFSVLQNCLKLSLAEKKTLEEELKELKQQLFSLQHDQSTVKASRSQSLHGPTPSPSSSTPRSTRSQSTIANPKLGEDTGSKSLKGDISMLQSCLQLAIAEKKALTEENEVLKGGVEEWQQKAKLLEAQVEKLEKLAPKTEEINKLKASIQSLEKENSGLLENEKKMHNRVKSLDTKKAQLLAEKMKLKEEIEKLNQKVSALNNEKAKQQRAVEKHHKSVQTVSEKSLDRSRPGSAESKATSRVTFYRSNSQNSDPDVHADQKKPQVVESPTRETKMEHKKLQATDGQASEIKAEHKKIQVAESQASEMKVACRLNIASHSPVTSPSSERHFKVSQTKSLTSDYASRNKHISDIIDGESNDNKYLSSSLPASSKPAVTSVKVSTSIKKETPTKINAMLLKNSSSPQLQSHSTSHLPAHTVATVQSHVSTVASHSPTPGTVTVQSANTRVTSGAVSPGSSSTSHSVQLGAPHQTRAHVTTTSHATPSVVAQSSVTSSPVSSSTTQPSSVTTTHQPVTSSKPRPFFKSNTMMSFVTSKPSGSPSHSPMMTPKSSVSSIPTVVTSPPKPNTDNSASTTETNKPPLQKTTSLTVNSSSSTEVVRRRTSKGRSQQILDPMKRSSAYYPTDISSLSITEENELHRCGSLESLKSALFHAASAKVHPSVASSSVSTSSNVPPVNSTATTSSTAAVTSTTFSSPIPRAMSTSKLQSQEGKQTEAKKEVKFVNNNNQQSPIRLRPRAARHQSINTPVPPVSSYYSPSTPTRYGPLYVCILF